jgi:hypothetical protein
VGLLVFGGEPVQLVSATAIATAVRGPHRLAILPIDIRVMLHAAGGEGASSEMQWRPIG